MPIPIQYDLFEPIPNEFEIMQKQITALEESQEKLRKGLFARHTELVKLVMIQQKEIDLLKQLLRK